MPTGSNLKICASTYYVRLKVPVELRHLMNTGELSRSPEMKDGRTANVRKLSVLAEWHQTFQELRRRRDMTEADFAAATWELCSAGPIIGLIMRKAKGRVCRVDFLALGITHEEFQRQRAHGFCDQLHRRRYGGNQHC